MAPKPKTFFPKPLLEELGGPRLQPGISQYNLLPPDTARALNFLDMVRLWNVVDSFSQMKVSTEY